MLTCDTRSPHQTIYVAQSSRTSQKTLGPLELSTAHKAISKKNSKVHRKNKLKTVYDNACIILQMFEFPCMCV